MQSDYGELVERLNNLRVTLKSGEYDGADLMRAWCAMMDAKDAITTLQAERDAAWNDAIEAAAAMVQANYPFDKRALVPAIRTLNRSKP